MNGWRNIRVKIKIMILLVGFVAMVFVWAVQVQASLK